MPALKGMYTGATSPSQPWLRNMPMVPAISEVGMKKRWKRTIRLRSSKPTRSRTLRYAKSFKTSVNVMICLSFLFTKRRGQRV